MKIHKTVKNAAKKYGVDVEFTKPDPFADEMVYKAYYDPEDDAYFSETAASNQARDGVFAIELVAERAGLD